MLRESFSRLGYSRHRLHNDWPEADGLMAAMRLAMVAKLPSQRIRDAVFAHPNTVAGAWACFRQSSGAFGT